MSGIPNKIDLQDASRVMQILKQVANMYEDTNKTVGTSAQRIPVLGAFHNFIKF